MRVIGILGVAAVLTVGLINAPAQAQPVHAKPASILIFPLFDSSAGNNTIITVTNVNADEQTCGNGFRNGDVQVHYVYTDGETCQASDTDEDLTPADTESVLARGHNPNFEVGYLVAEARDPETNFPIDFDFLIGSAIVVNSEFDFQWAYTPYGFEALVTAGDADDCLRIFTDTPANLADFDKIDFDGAEYSAFPDRLYLDKFFGSGDAGNVSFDNVLYLMSTDSTTDPLIRNVFMTGYNNNERRFSRDFHVGCHRVGSLQDLTGAATQTSLGTNSDDGELGGIETGWFRLDFAVPTEGMLGVFKETTMINGVPFTAGRELQFSGRRVVCLPRF